MRKLLGSVEVWEDDELNESPGIRPLEGVDENFEPKSKKWIITLDSRGTNPNPEAKGEVISKPTTLAHELGHFIQGVFKTPVSEEDRLTRKAVRDLSEDSKGLAYIAKRAFRVSVSPWVFIPEGWDKVIASEEEAWALAEGMGMEIKSQDRERSLETYKNAKSVDEVAIAKAKVEAVNHPIEFRKLKAKIKLLDEFSTELEVFLGA